MVLYSLPLAGLVYLLARSSWFQQRLAPSPRYLVAAVAGAGLGLLWALAAAILTLGWLAAFSFPVLICWMFGGVAGLVLGAWRERPSTWPIAAALLLLASLGAAQQFHYAQTPPPSAVLYLKPSATDEEVQRVWEEVVGVPHPSGQGHNLKEGISSVGVSGYEGDQALLTVTFWKSTSQARREQLLKEVAASPLVQRIEPVDPAEYQGIRRSVEH